MIPCEECILLAACRHKENIRCSLLYEWGQNHDDWNPISEFLKEWIPVSIEDEVKNNRLLIMRRRI